MEDYTNPYDIPSERWDDMTPEELQERNVKAMLYGCVSYVIMFFVMLILMLLFGSCKTGERIVTIETVRTDTCYVAKHLHDSIWQHDSIYLHEWQAGDTVYRWRDRWHTKYIEKQVHDTIYKSRTDSVPVPYPFPEYVEKPLNWWQRTTQGTGTLALIALLCWLVWQAARFYLRRF